MATVTTTNTPNPDLRVFQKSADPAAPFAELLFDGTFTIAALDAANESQVIISMALPTNFVYRIQSMEIQQASTGANVFTPATQKAWTCVITENQVTTRRFGLFSQAMFYLSTSAVALATIATTNNFGTWFQPAPGFGNQLIDASRGSSIVTLQWIDQSADATAAIGTTFRCMFLAYTYEQFNQAPINTIDWTS